MTHADLRKLPANELIDLFAQFVKMYHYEATDEFNDLREMEIGYDDVKEELKRRMW